MSRVNFIQNSFLGGEFSPRLYGRTDLPRWNHGCEEVKNFVVLPQGGIYRRNGTMFVTETPSNNKSRLVPFVFSDAETYAIELSNNSIRAINNSDHTITTITTASATTYTEAQIDEVQFTQSGDILFLVYEGKEPILIARTAENTFAATEYTASTIILGNVAFGSKFGFLENSDAGLTLTRSSTTGTITVTASKSFFTSGHVGAVFRIGGGELLITVFTNDTTVTATHNVNQSSSSATADFSESWSDATGWPRTVTFFRSRLVFGGVQARPDTIWASEIENFGKFSLDQEATDTVETSTSASPSTFTIASQQANQIQWLASGKNLNVGTLGDEYIVTNLDPDDVNVNKETSHGSRYVQAVQNSNALMFVEKTGRYIREFSFDLDADSFQARNLSLISEHLFDEARQELNDTTFSGVKQIAFQESPHGILWCVDDSGGLFGCTREQQQDIAAWHVHRFGGTGHDDESIARVESVISLPGNIGEGDSLWVVVQRRINGSNKRYVETIGPDFRDDVMDSAGVGTSTVPTTSKRSDEYFVDSALFKDLGTPGTSVTGLSHLEGETVQVMADGFFVGTATVSSGAITLDAEATSVIVGLQFVSTVRTLRMERGSAIGSAQGLIKRIDRVHLRFFDTIAAFVGPTSDNLEEISFKDPAAAMNLPIAPFTGDKVFQFQNGVDDKGIVVVEQQKPFPMGIAALIMRAQTYES